MKRNFTAQITTSLHVLKASNAAIKIEICEVPENPLPAALLKAESFNKQQGWKLYFVASFTNSFLGANFAKKNPKLQT